MTAEISKVEIYKPLLGNLKVRAYFRVSGSNADYIGASLMAPGLWDTFKDLPPHKVNTLPVISWLLESASVQGYKAEWEVTDAELQASKFIWVALWDGIPGGGGSEVTRTYVPVNYVPEASAGVPDFSKLVGGTGTTSLSSILIPLAIIAGIGLVAFLVIRK